MGHVNHAVYLQYMETARVELAKKLHMIYDVSSSGFIVAMAHCEYKKPIRNEPSVTVTCWVTRISDRSWDLDYTIESGKIEHAKGRTTQVGYNFTRRSSARISDKLRKLLKRSSGKPLKFRSLS